MKVNRYGGRGMQTERAIKSEPGKTYDSGLFRLLLEDADAVQQKTELDRMLQEVSRLGEAFVAVQSMDAAFVYRQAVKRYIEVLVKGSMSVSSKSTTDHYGKQKIFSVVEEIDAKLSELLNLAISDQKEPLSLLHVVGEVKGLLISLST